jgi:Ca-activated chloride channel family protein
MKAAISKLILCFFALMLSIGCRAAGNTLTLKAELEKPILPASVKQTALIRITLLAPETDLPEKDRKNKVNLSIVLDKSGSMSSRNKMREARTAAITALQMLRRGDMFSIITYDTSPQVLIPATALTPENRARAIGLIQDIRPEGNTALFGGVSLGANEIRKNAKENFVNRLILLSDGLANVGPSSPAELGRFGASLIKENISVSTIGVGTDYNEDLMTALSQNSDGNFYYVENSADLPRIFSKELGSALKVAAKSIRLKIICPEGVKPQGILGHECRINGNIIEMNFNQVYGGHEKSLILQVEVPPKNAGSQADIAKVEVDYKGLEGKYKHRVVNAVTARFSSDHKIVESNVNLKVKAEVAVQQSAVLQEEAVEQADKGKFAEAKKKLGKAVVLLNDAAVATGDKELKRQAESVEVRQKNLAPSNYNRSRKQLKGSSYQVLNSQTYIQKKESE